MYDLLTLFGWEEWHYGWIGSCNCTPTRIHVHVYVHEYVHVYVHAYVHIYVHVYTHAYAHFTLFGWEEWFGITDELRVASLRHFPTTSFPSCQVVLLCKRLQLNASECHIVLLSGVSEWYIAYFLVVICLGLTMLHCVLSELQIYVGAASSSLI